MDCDSLVILMAKNPISRPVKTRLAEDIGVHKAKEVYQELVDINVRELLKLNSVETLLCIDGGFDYFYQYGLKTVAQSGDDLQNRILNVLNTEWQKFKKIVLIGSDCPFITSVLLDEVLARLGDVDVVIQPALDGGYTLIGLSRPVPELFLSMPFSTEKLYSESITRLIELGYSFYELPQSYDIDTVEDLNRWKQAKAL
ncbi:MAG: TIGR04282 family arsenosugar biosynthesis glycosyltransferase [Candidatus Cloacimonetes bacterium]|nr:TIGR04282 family arsenosugar biosynthesis glycosyltransferase [Candidatus Cloacimonadota bacterium]